MMLSPKHEELFLKNQNWVEAIINILVFFIYHKIKVKSVVCGIYVTPFNKLQFSKLKSELAFTQGTDKRVLFLSTVTPKF